MVAADTFTVALVGTVEVLSAVLAIKRVDPASTKQKEELEFPQTLQKPLDLQPGTQLKVGRSNMCTLMLVGPVVHFFVVPSLQFA